MRSNNRNSGGMDFIGWLQLAFVILKIIGAIHWSWFWVLSPFWGWFLIAFILAMISYEKEICFSTGGETNGQKSNL